MKSTPARAVCWAAAAAFWVVVERLMLAKKETISPNTTAARPSATRSSTTVKPRLAA